MTAVVLAGVEAELLAEVLPLGDGLEPLEQAASATVVTTASAATAKRRETVLLKMNSLTRRQSFAYHHTRNETPKRFDPSERVTNGQDAR